MGHYHAFTLCQQFQVDELIGEGKKCRKKESILTDDMIMKFDLNIWGIWVKQRLRLLVYVSFPMTQIKNILRCLNVHVCLEGE